MAEVLKAFTTGILILEFDNTHTSANAFLTFHTNFTSIYDGLSNTIILKYDCDRIKKYKVGKVIKGMEFMQFY